MSRSPLTSQKTAERVASWVGFVGANLIAIMSYFVLWVENPRRLPIIFAFIPLQIVTDIFLLRWRNDWKRMRVVEWLIIAILVWFSWSCIHNREWYLLPAVAFGFMMLIWRFSRLKKREVDDRSEK